MPEIKLTVSAAAAQRIVVALPQRGYPGTLAGAKQFIIAQLKDMVQDEERAAAADAALKALPNPTDLPVS